MSVRSVSIPRQVGGQDCGLYAIAIATALALVDIFKSTLVVTPVSSRFFTFNIPLTKLVSHKFFG